MLCERNGDVFKFNDFGHVYTFYGKQGSVSLQAATRFLKFNPLKKVLAGAKPLINNTAYTLNIGETKNRETSLLDNYCNLASSVMVTQVPCDS